MRRQRIVQYEELMNGKNSLYREEEKIAGGHVKVYTFRSFGKLRYKLIRKKLQLTHIEITNMNLLALKTSMNISGDTRKYLLGVKGAEVKFRRGG